MTDDSHLPTLVLIPGLLSDQIVWQSTAALVSSRLSVHPADTSGMESITGAAQKILDDVQGSLVVIGHSLGGRIALELVRLAPERVLGLVLADCGTHARAAGEAEKRLELIEYAHRQGMQALAERWLPPMVHKAFHGSHPVMKSLQEMVLRATPQQHERQMKALLDRPDAESVLRKITCPVLVLVGRRDEWSPVGQHESIHRAICGSEMVVIEDAGHFAPVEQPVAVAEAINHWLVCCLPD